jgi:hypothetical protein
MSKLTDVAEDEVLEILFRGTGLFNDKQFALFTSGTDLEIGNLSNELEDDPTKSPGYARVEFNGDEPFAAASGGNMVSNMDITFPQNVTFTNWETATHWGIIKKSTGDLKVYGQLTTPLTVLPYHAARIASGNLTITAS